MPGGSRTDLVILGVLAAVAVAVVAFLTSSGLIRDESEGRLTVRTTYSAEPGGCLAAHMLFERMGVASQRCTRPLNEHVLDQYDVLFMLDPLLPMQAHERRQLLAWVRAGGVLVATEEVRDQLRHPEHWDDVEVHEPDDDPEMRRLLRRYEDKSPGITVVPPARRELPLSRDVGRVEFEGTLVLTSPEETFGDGEERTTVPLFRDEEGIRVAAESMGRGTVVVMSDCSFLSNDLLGREDNPVLAMNLATWGLSRARGDRLAFDEYHQGRGLRETGWTVMAAMLLTTSAGWAVLTVTGAGVLYLVYRGRRLGTRRSPGRVRRRSKVEYVRSVGATLRDARANDLVYRQIHGWFMKRLALRLSLPPTSPIEPIARAASRRAGIVDSRLRDVLERCDAAAKDPGLSTHRMVSLIRQLADVEREVVNERAGSR